MIALKIRLNGDYVLVAGQPDMSILSSHITVSRGNTERGADDYIRLAAHGLSHDTDKGYPEHFRWKEHQLEVGDLVEIEVVETEQIDSPVKRYRSDREVQENPFTKEEIREMRYETYLELKEEFEGKETSG